MPYNLPLDEPAAIRGGLADNTLPIQATAEQWREGVTRTSQCDVTAFRWQCGRSEGDPKETTDLGDADTFYPTMIGVATDCTVFGSRSLIGNRQLEVAQGGLALREWSMLALTMYDGLVGNGAAGDENPNPSFYGSATLVPSQSFTAPAPIPNTLEGMLDTYCSRWSGEVVIHVPQQFLPYWIDQELVTLGEDGVYRHGHHRVSFDCYPNSGPTQAVDDSSDPDATVDPPDGAFWMYMSSVPRVGFADVSSGESTDPQQNMHSAVAERGAIITFEPCSVVAALASVYPLAPNEAP